MHISCLCPTFMYSIFSTLELTHYLELPAMYFVKKECQFDDNKQDNFSTFGFISQNCNKNVRLRVRGGQSAEGGSRLVDTSLKIVQRKGEKIVSRRRPVPCAPEGDETLEIFTTS